MFGCSVNELWRVLILTNFPCPVPQYSRVESREIKADANDLPDTREKKIKTDLKFVQWKLKQAYLFILYSETKHALNLEVEIK